MKSWILRYWKAIAVLLVLLFWAILLYIIPAEYLVESVGLQNSYLISFVLASIAGFSSLSGTGVYAAVIGFSRGGADPLYLGLASGIGLFISDTAFFLLVMRGREPIETRFQNLFKRMQQLFERIPNIFVYVLTYLFFAFWPIPNDLIISALVIAGYEYKRMWPLILAGDVTIMLFLSYLFQQ